MKHKLILIVFLLCFVTSIGQNASPKYYKFIEKADSLYAAQDYKNSAFMYSEAFKENGWKGYSHDRYNAACSWALANYPDSAFFNLFKIADFLDYMDYNHITTDIDLNSLHEDKRWQILIKKVKENKDKAEEHLNKPLVHILDTIYTEDQKYRMQMDDVGKKYGWNSEQMKALWKTANEKDAINLNKVISILDKYGWLGPEEIGQQGNTTIFLVIQHSDQKTQEKYLPMMRDAVKNKKASASSLALLEDRVALGQGKKQIYGSQVSGISGQYYLLPLEDPDNVDKRRAEVGLPPLADYVKQWQIKWDVEAYKKNEQQSSSINECDISTLEINSSGFLTWNSNSQSQPLIYEVEQYRWKKWVKIAEVDSKETSESHIYGCKILTHHGENVIRIKISTYPCISRSITVDLNIPLVTFTLDAKKKEIYFSNETLYEISDIKNMVLKRGFGTVVSYENLPKGLYTLNYDNSTTEFKR